LMRFMVMTASSIRMGTTYRNAILVGKEHADELELVVLGEAGVDRLVVGKVVE
jgi:hypothetical protein